MGENVPVFDRVANDQAMDKHFFVLRGQSEVVVTQQNGKDKELPDQSYGSCHRPGFRCSKGSQRSPGSNATGGRTFGNSTTGRDYGNVM